eukprot:5791288-Alexandrium_andersonii.AAC.1
MLGLQTKMNKDRRGRFRTDRRCVSTLQHRRGWLARDQGSRSAIPHLWSLVAATSRGVGFV